VQLPGSKIIDSYFAYLSVFAMVRCIFVLYYVVVTRPS